MTSGPNFYDEDDVFKRYIQRRTFNDSPNDTIEGPAFLDVLGDYTGLDILDLGCGDGRFGVELLGGGCQSYTGLEASERMFDLAQKQLTPLGGVSHHHTIEDWTYPEQAFDLVISRLVIHYINDIDSLFEQIYRSLKPHGRLIFSVEHPILTSHNESLEISGKRSNWIVDNYFSTGARNVKWMGSEVIKYHRTIEDYIRTLQINTFTLEHFREPAPDIKNFSDTDLYARRMRIPLFLLLSASRD